MASKTVCTAPSLPYRPVSFHYMVIWDIVAKLFIHRSSSVIFGYLYLGVSSPVTFAPPTAFAYAMGFYFPRITVLFLALLGRNFY